MNIETVDENDMIFNIFENDIDGANTLGSHSTSFEHFHLQQVKYY